jgi:hypothetical protein
LDNISPTDAEKESIKKAMETMLKSSYELAHTNRKFISWMTTMASAALGFFLTILLQMKSKMALPIQPVAILSLALFLVCILSGFYARFRFEVKDWFQKITDIVDSVFMIIYAALDKTMNQSVGQEDAN